MRLHRRPRHGFTLIELIVTLVVLAILAGIGLVSYSQVTTHAQDSATATTLATTGREAQALAAQRGTGTLSEDDFTAAAADLPTPSAGTSAAGWVITTNPGGYVLKAGRLHVRVATDGHLAGMAAVSASGNCVLAKVPANGPVHSWSVGSVAANCSGDIALDRPVGSTVASLDPAQAGPPAAPTGVTAAPTATGFTVTWDANGEPTVAGYRLVVDGVAQTANILGTSATVPAPPGPHTVAVLAVNTAGQTSEASSVQDVTVPPAPPASVTATLSGTTATITWAAAPTATSYRILRAVDGGTAALLTQVDAPATTATDVTAPAGATVVYSVAAANAGGESTATAADAVTLPVDIPTDVTAVAAGTTITLSWGATPGADSYTVYRDGDATAVATGLTATTWADTNLPAGSTHSYTVASVGDAGQGPASAPVSATVAPAAPAAVSATAVDTTITVTWGAVNAATSYTVYRNGATVWTGAATTLTNSGLARGTRYSYTVAATNPAGTGPTSTAAAATTAPAGVPAASVSLSGTTATVSWTAAPGATSYQVARSYTTMATGQTTYGTVGTVTGTSLADPVPVPNGTVVGYTVTASNSAGPAPAVSAGSVQTTQVTDTAPVAQANVLPNGGFESGLWTVRNTVGATVNQVRYTQASSGVAPAEGSYFVAFNTTIGGTSIHQDATAATAVGQVWCISGLVEANEGSGNLTVWNMNGTSGLEGSSATFSHLPGPNNWLRVSTCLRISKPGTGLRAEMYMNTGPTTYLDHVLVWRNS